MTVWTPRPRHPDEPACWSWPLPGAPTDEERGGMFYEAAAWRFYRFHTGGGCAVCGERPPDGRRVEDHDHKTGMVRGLLCRGCNVREGKSAAPLLVWYRRIHPAQILDVYLPYTGIGWVNGWWLGDCPGDPDDLGPRPARPWNSWTVPQGKESS